MSDLSRVHRELLERFRHSMNLIGPGPAEEHFADCEAALEGLQPAGRWVDLGSGAGFPGLPMAARFPALQLVLVDSRRKRCAFLEHVLDEASVPKDRVEVRCQRVEELQGPFDGVVSRAFTAPEGVLEHAARLLRPGGSVVLFLQADAPVPTGDRWSVVHDRLYTVAGKRRRSVALCFT